jgi:hypothetical protein
VTDPARIDPSRLVWFNRLAVTLYTRCPAGFTITGLKDGGAIVSYRLGLTPAQAGEQQVIWGPTPELALCNALHRLS